MPQFIRKISSATMGWKKPEIQEACITKKTDQHLLYRVVGIATGVRTGKNKFDDRDEASEWTALLGRFRAFSTHKDADNPYDSGVCFLPQYVTDAIAGKLSLDTAGVKFAYDIYAAYKEDSATSYEFGASDLIPPAEDDPLLALTDQAMSKATLPPSAQPKALEKPAAKA